MDILIKDGVQYSPKDFHGKEAEFEKLVFTQYKYLFGENTILFTKQKIKTVTNIGTIPDAFIIDFENEKWYIIEIEISNHDVYSHIVPQLTKFHSALNNQQTRKQLLKFFDSEIKADPYKHALLLVNNKNEVFKTVSEIIDSTPELIIIIEKQHEELSSIFNSLPFKTKVNVFKTFTRVGVEQGDNIFQFELMTKLSSRIETPSDNNIFIGREVERVTERKRGRGNRDQLTDYIIPAIKMMNNGARHSEAFHQIKDILNVSYQTVNAQCTTRLKINTERFVELVNSGKIVDLLKTTFPDRHAVINKEL